MHSADAAALYCRCPARLPSSFRLSSTPGRGVRALHGVVAHISFLPPTPTGSPSRISMAFCPPVVSRLPCRRAGLLWEGFPVVIVSPNKLLQLTYRTAVNLVNIEVTPNWEKRWSALRSKDRRCGTCNPRTVSGGYNPTNASVGSARIFDAEPRKRVQERTRGSSNSSAAPCSD